MNNQEITKKIHKVLLSIIARLGFENWIQVPQNEICRELKIKKQHVSVIIKLLEQKKIILRDPKLGKFYAFRVNPYFG